jgi:DNA-binding response OmpR family regulator
MIFREYNKAAMNELILVVDDEPKVVKLARDYLVKNGFRVISAGDGLGALAAFRREKPDLVVLDLMLPGMDGREVCRAIRRDSSVPIIMLTALSDESDQVAGLELGADDYVSKPFSPRALVARVRAHLRRVEGNVKMPAVVRIGRLSVDRESYLVMLDGQEIHLTPNEFKLLAVLTQHAGQTFSREQLMDEVHGAAPNSFDRSIDSHIKNLRKKLENASQTADRGGLVIETIYGIGYRLRVRG